MAGDGDRDPAALRDVLGRLRSRVGRSSGILLAGIARSEQVFMVLAAVLVGTLAAYGALGFRYLILLSQQLFYPGADPIAGLLGPIPWWQRLLMPALGGLVLGVLVTRLAPEVRGSGIPEVMEAVSRRGGAIRRRVVGIKAAAAALTIGSGGSAGREGPIVHIGAALGSALGQLLRISPRRSRTLVACGAAAGIAATFNAPIAGALFSMEVVLGNLGVANLAPIVIASVVATVISRFHLGDFPAFGVPSFELVSARELPLYAGLGVIAGGVAVVLIWALYRSGDLFDRLPLPAWVRPAAGGLLVGAIALVLPQVSGVGYGTVNAALAGEMAGQVLVAVVAAKILATALSLGSGGSGGVFAPSLVVGAALGAAWGGMSHTVFPQWTAGPSAYGLVGMGALVAASTHAPITAILMIFELTNDYRSIPPLMLACVTGVLVSSQLHRQSIYTTALVRRGVRLEADRDVNLLRTVPVREVLEASVLTVLPSLPLRALLPLLLDSHEGEAMVVDEEGRLVGGVALPDFRDRLADIEAGVDGHVVEAVMRRDLPCLLPEDNLDLAMQLFGRVERDELGVCDDLRRRRFLGVVSRHAVIEVYNRRIFQRDLAGGFGSLVEGSREGRTLEVAEGIHLGEIEVPFSLAGMTLEQAALRLRHGVEVILIYTPDSAAATVRGRPGKVPRADTRLEVGERLLVMGSAEAIAKLRQ